MIKEGETVRIYTYTIHPSDNAILEELGKDNRSAGLRYLIKNFGPKALTKFKKESKKKKTQ